MAFRVCCSCKTPLGPSEGFVSRLCRVTQTLGTSIGTESYFWTPVAGYSDKWTMSFTAPSTGEFLLEGFRVEWYGPTQNGQKFNGMFPFTDTTSLSGLYQFIPNAYLNRTPATGTRNKNDSENFGTLGSTNYSHFLSTKVPLGGHVSNEDLRGIMLGTSNFPVRSSDAVYDSLPSNVRVKYWRMLENGEPATDIINGYHPDSRTLQTLYPSNDVSATDWNTTGGTEFWSLLNELVASADLGNYVWSSDTASDSLKCTLTDFTYTGGYNHVSVAFRASWTNGSGVLIAGTGGITAELQYQNETIARTSMNLTSNGTTWATVSAVFRSITDVAQPYRESCSFIPVDATASGFSIKINPTTASSVKRLGIAALNVVSTPFTYSLATTSVNAPTPYWPIEAAYRIPWRKNVRLGFDIWLEAIRSAGQSMTAALGRNHQSAGKYEGLYSTVAHGTLGIRTTFTPEYDHNQFAYYAKFLNGTWRPSGMDVDDADRATFNASNYIATNDRPGYFKSIGQSPTDGQVMSIRLLWNKEVPEVHLMSQSGGGFLVNGTTRSVLRYLPEDTGHAITNFYFYHGSTLGNVYVNSQSPGGVWKHKKVTKFVLEAPCQVNTTNSFSSEPLLNLSDFPTEIEVGPAYPPQTYSFWETTDWECPDNVTEVTVRCWGGGGGGGATDDYSGSAAGGGGGGAFSSKVVSVTPGTTYTITVGSGGAAGVEGNINGQAGGDSWFSDAGTVMAKGGSGGTGALLDEDEAGGAGGASASGVGTTKFSGGDGADGSSGNYGGGGGASAGTNNNGAAATNGAGANGTNNGGNGGSSGTAGGPPGGGGGGAKGTAASDTILPGGAGGGGLVTLRY